MGKQKKVFLVLAVLVTIYLAITFGLPPETATLERYQISELRLRFLQLTIAFPLVAIWYAAFYGFARFKHYAELIKKSPDGQAFTRLANGLMVLAIGLPVGSIVSASLRYAARVNPELAPAAAITDHYVALGIALIGFGLIGSGAERLLGLGHRRPAWPGKFTSSLGFLVFGALYAYLILTHPPTTAAAAGSAQTAIYHLPNWLIMTTVIMPYLYIWHTGLMAALNIDSYKRAVAGVLYKKSLRFLAWGIGSVIISSMVLQFLTTATQTLSKLRLAPLLAVVYVLLVIVSVGYIFIAMGAKRLQKLEEV